MERQRAFHLAVDNTLQNESMVVVNLDAMDACVDRDMNLKL